MLELEETRACWNKQLIRELWYDRRREHVQITHETERTDQ